jgi:hypothetical protein
MVNRIARHTWPNSILFLAVYVALFAVQLHFKYSVYHPNNSGLDIDASAVRYTSGKCSVDRSIETNYKSNKLNIKVSKRYQHKTIYEVPLIIVPAVRIFTRAATPFTFSSARLCHQDQPGNPHRGPPAIG